MNYAAAELKNIFIKDLIDIYSFCLEHSVQVYLGSDFQYEVWIDGKGSYGSWITFFGALYGGINLYNNPTEDE